MSYIPHTNGRKWVQAALCFVCLVSLSHSGYSQDNKNNYTIEVESEGTYLLNEGVSKQLAKTLALFNAKRAAVELAGKYFRKKNLIEPYEHKKDEIYNILADEIGKNILTEKWTSISKTSKYVVRIGVKIDVTDFIRAEILNLEYERKEAKESFRKKMEPNIRKDSKPGHDLAHVYRLLRKTERRPALIFLDGLEKKYPGWGDIFLVKSYAYYTMHELELMKASLKKACQLDIEEACDDLRKIKRLHEHDFGL